MRTDDANFWNLLFDQQVYAFGETPNRYMVDKLEGIPPANVLLPGDGEGRNAVYLASRGWKAAAFDLSEKGKEKADRLAQKNNVELDFRVGDVKEMTYPENYFDALVLIFAHFMPDQRRAYHQKLLSYLKPGGKLVLEGYARLDEEPVDTRFNLKELKTDFKGVDFIEAKTTWEELNEGSIITGRTQVVQIFAIT